LFSLNLLCGISDTSLVGLTKPDIQLQNKTDISHSPQMLQYNLDSLRNANNKLLVDIAYKPKLDAFADVGFMSSNPKNIPHNFGTSIGLNFSVPIYDGRLRKLEYSRIAVAEQTRLYYRDFYRSQYQLRVQQSQEQLKSTDELVVAISDQLTAQQDLIHLYKVEMEKGLVRFSDFIIAVNNYATTRNTLKQAEINRQQVINNLNYIK
jgi:outer membrane protein TolC